MDYIKRKVKEVSNITIEIDGDKVCYNVSMYCKYRSYGEFDLILRK